METTLPQQPDWRRFLREHSDEGRAAFAASLIPCLRYPIHGVRLPDLRQLAKKLVKANWRVLVDHELTDASLEENLLRGFLIGYAKMEWSERKERVAEFVTHIDNWSVCDSCCASFTTFREHREEGWVFLQPYIHSSREYEQRFAAVMMLNHFLCDEHIDRVLKTLKRIRPVAFYSKMAVGWALATAFSKYPEQTYAVLCQEDLLPECRQIARRKILESKQTTARWRVIIKQLRKD